jgi:hypothetical protein
VSRLSARASHKKDLLRETQTHSRLNVVVDEAIEKKNSEKRKKKKKKPSATPFVVIATQHTFPEKKRLSTLPVS